VEDIGVSERKTQRDTRATGEATDVYLLRVYRVLSHDVVQGKQRQRLTAVDGGSFVAGVCRGHQNCVVAIERRNPMARHFCPRPRRDKHQ